MEKLFRFYDFLVSKFHFVAFQFSNFGSSLFFFDYNFFKFRFLRFYNFNFNFMISAIPFFRFRLLSFAFYVFQFQFNDFGNSVFSISTSPSFAFLRFYNFNFATLCFVISAIFHFQNHSVFSVNSTYGICIEPDG